MATESKAAECWEVSEFTALKDHVAAIDKTHLRDLVEDEERNSGLVAEADNFVIDYSRQRVTATTMELLHKLARATGLKEKIEAMRTGRHINITEDRAVLHCALRAPASESIVADGEDVVPAVHEVLSRIKSFSGKLRSGEWKGATGKNIVNVISIGIGGSYLGPEFVYEALRHDPASKAAAEGRTLRFLANVDPVDVARGLEGYDPETTLVVIVSKTFTTAETILNAKTVRKWLVDGLTGKEGVEAADIVGKHVIACSANVPLAAEFGILPENVFGFWDWVGGRYSVCAAVGVMPLSLQYGYDIIEQFLAGAHAMDKHFFTTDLEKNLPVVLGLLGVWNSTFLGYSTRAILPYSQALLRFPAHIQQVDMESNGKRVTTSGKVLPFAAGEINFGEPGTNGQHSFYQLIHQGRVVPCDFIGTCESQAPIMIDGEPVSNHDELMSNFFAQPDALARGKSLEDLEAAGVPEELRPHKVFPGNRPSTSILINKLDAFAVGQLLALYEHRTVVQGFIWGVPSFDQWGVELGKVLAKQVRAAISTARGDGSSDVAATFNPSTRALLKRYLSHK